jgi:hypothetical protein
VLRKSHFGILKFAEHVCCERHTVQARPAKTLEDIRKEAATKTKAQMSADAAKVNRELPTEVFNLPLPPSLRAELEFENPGWSQKYKEVKPPPKFYWDPFSNGRKARDMTPREAFELLLKCCQKDMKFKYGITYTTDGQRVTWH